MNALTSQDMVYSIVDGARTSSWRKPPLSICGYFHARFMAGVPVIKHPQGKYRGLTNSGSSSRHQAVLEAVQVVFFNAKLEA